MKLDLDCVRDILLEMETSPLNAFIKDDNLYLALPNHNKDEIQYACRKLYEAGLIRASIVEADNFPAFHVTAVYEITFAGHQFLEKIRDNHRWRGIKRALPAVRDYSLDAITALANGFASAAITSYLAQTQEL